MYSNCRMTSEKNIHWFKEKEIAYILGYVNTDQAVRKNIDPEDKF